MIRSSFRFMWLSAWVGAALLPSIGEAQSAASVTAFTNVSVVPMDRERVLTDYTVVIADGRITALGPAGGVPVPTDAVRVDGRGKYLMPGLADMHAHLMTDDARRYRLRGSELMDLAKRQLAAYVAHGVTTIRNMAGIPWHLQLRRQAERGDLVSPRIYTAGPIVNRYAAPTPELAKHIVAEHLLVGSLPATIGGMGLDSVGRGYDFLKVYDGLPGPVFDTLVAAVTRVGLPLAGHIPTAWGDTVNYRSPVERALGGPYRSMEHLHGYTHYVTGTSVWDDDSVRLGAAEDARILEIARKTAEAGVWNVPTLSLLLRMFDRRPDIGELYLRITKSLHEAGAGLLLGTDAWFCTTSNSGALSGWVAGFVVHEELEAFVKAGLSPYAALATGTRNVAEFWGTLEETGTVEVGKRADLVLLDGNPLENVGVTRHPAGVVLNGKWLSRAALDGALAPFGVTDINSMSCPKE